MTVTEEHHDKEIELELIVSGDVHGVGYRQYVKKIARKLKLKGSAKNLEDDTVQIRCKGLKENINEFKRMIIVKNPINAPLIDVEEIISETTLEKGTVKEKTFVVIPGKIEDEILDSNMTGINYLNLFREETNRNFNKMFEKQDEMLGKQDEMLGKHDKMLGKQDETVKEIRNGFDKVTKKQDDTIGEISNMRNDLKSYFDSRITKLEKDVFQIKKKIKIAQ